MHGNVDTITFVDHECRARIGSIGGNHAVIMVGLFKIIVKCKIHNILPFKTIRSQWGAHNVKVEIPQFRRYEWQKTDQAECDGQHSCVAGYNPCRILGEEQGL